VVRPKKKTLGASANGLDPGQAAAKAADLAAARAEAQEDDLILVTGSLYTVADARPAAPRST
jgi:folylpolyglutamate synthase/dihydropteroate synthase